MRKIVIVGSGSIARRHLTAARIAYPKCEIMILRRFKSAIDFPKVEHMVYSMEEVQEFEPELAIIATPASDHIKTARAFTERKTPLLIEKPISSGIDGVSDFLKFCKQQGNFLRTGYNLRHLDSLQVFRQMCIDEVKGRVLSVHSTVGQFLPDWRPGQDYRKGVSAQAKLGGGALFELSHEIDYMLWVFGDIQWVRATLATKSELELDVEDSVHLTLGIEQKSSRKTLIATLNMDFIRRDSIRECQAVCEFGTIKWDGLENQISIYDSSLNKWSSVYTGRVSMVQTYEEQLKVIGKDLQMTKEETKTELDGLRVLEVIEASRKSAPTGLQTQVTKNAIG